MVAVRGATRWTHGHPWIYRSDVMRHPAGAGIVPVLDERGRFLGQALCSPQSEIRLRLLLSRIREVRGQIDLVYDELASVDYDKVGARFRRDSAERLFREEIGLRQEYALQGGKDPEVLTFVNVADVISLLEQYLPKWTLAVGYAREKRSLFGQDTYFPGIQNRYWGFYAQSRSP